MGFGRGDGEGTSARQAALGRLMPFDRIAPQHVRHDSGFEVFVLDREPVGHAEPGTRAAIEVDFGSVVFVYADSLRYQVREAAGPDPSVITDRIVEGLRAMGSEVAVG